MNCQSRFGFLSYIIFISLYYIFIIIGYCALGCCSNYSPYFQPILQVLQDKLHTVQLNMLFRFVHNHGNQKLPKRRAFLYF